MPCLLQFPFQLPLELLRGSQNQIVLFEDPTHCCLMLYISCYSARFVGVSEWGFSLVESITLRSVWLLHVRSARKRERSAQHLLE